MISFDCVIRHVVGKKKYIFNNIIRLYFTLMILNRDSLFRVLVYTTLTYRSFEDIVKIPNPLYRKTLIQIKPLLMFL